MNRWLALVRAPAATTVVGDTIVGSVVAGRRLSGRRLLLPLASTALYWSGMALNDWADRASDARERPERPIPAGLVTPTQALAVAVGGTAAGLGLAALGGGRDAVRVAAPLAGAVWLYDLALAGTPAAPAGMALCRGLDVLLGAGASRARAAAPAATVVAGHAAAVTVMSAAEVSGAGRRRAMAAVAGSVAVAASALATVRAPQQRVPRLAGLGGALYLAVAGPSQVRAVLCPSAQRARSATAAGIHATIALQAALVAGSGAPATATALAGLVPAARRLSRMVSPT